MCIPTEQEGHKELSDLPYNLRKTAPHLLTAKVEELVIGDHDSWCVTCCLKKRGFRNASQH